MTVQSAYEYGMQVALRGHPLEDLPEEFTAIEVEVAEAAYQEHFTAFHEHDYDLESIDMNNLAVEDDYQELNFH